MGGGGGGEMGCFRTEVIFSNTCLSKALLPLCVNRSHVMDLKMHVANCKTMYDVIIERGVL
jgi:hypothetical protein